MGLPQGVTEMARWGPFCLEVGGGFVTVPETLFFFGQNVRNKYLVREKQWSQKRSLGKRSESCAKISDKKRKFEVRNQALCRSSSYLYFVFRIIRKPYLLINHELGDGEDIDHFAVPHAMSTPKSAQ